MLLAISSPLPGKEISRVLVCGGHLCECQGSSGARALLKDLAKAKIDAQETSCLGMCGMGAMGCIEYDDGSEALTHSRDEMLNVLGVDTTIAECPVSPSESELSRILVCTGRMCQRQKNGGAELLNALRKEISEPERLEASPCLGSCGQGSLALAS